MCTSIKIDSPQGIVMGRTMDLEAQVDFDVLAFAGGYPTSENLMGGHFEGPYPMLGVCFREWDPLKDGMNDQGLIGVTNDFSGYHLFPDQVQAGKINVSSFHFLNYVLSHYASVAEVLADLDQFHLARHSHQCHKVISPLFHWMLADKTGRCVVIEPSKGKLIAYDNPYGVMTNAPKFPSHLRHLKRQMDLDQLRAFNGARDLPGAYDPKSRFVKAYYQSRLTPEIKTHQEAMAYLFQSLQAISLPRGFIANDRYQDYTFTQYIVAYDSYDQQLLLRTDTNPSLYHLTFDQLDLSQGRVLLSVPTFEAGCSLVSSQK